MTLGELLAGVDHELARTWGEREAAAAPAAAGERCLLVTCAGHRFAVPAAAVAAVGELPPISAVPFAPPWLRGVARAATGVVAVLDLARLLTAEDAGLPSAQAEAPAGAAGRETLLVVRTTGAAGAELDAGLAVRGIARLVTLAGAPGRSPAAGELGACRADLVARMMPDAADNRGAPVALLDLDRLLQAAREDLGA